jgi:hypothetical protein
MNQEQYYNEKDAPHVRSLRDREIQVDFEDGIQN